MNAYQPKTGKACGCRPGAQRDNCPACEGTGQAIDFAAIRANNAYFCFPHWQRKPCPECTPSAEVENGR